MLDEDRLWSSVRQQAVRPFDDFSHLLFVEGADDQDVGGLRHVGEGRLDHRAQRGEPFTHLASPCEEADFGAGSEQPLNHGPTHRTRADETDN